MLNLLVLLLLVMFFFHSLYFGPSCFLQYKWSGRLNDIEKVNIRLYNHTETIIALKNLKAAYISKKFCLYPCVLYVVHLNEVLTCRFTSQRNW
jgi:hypothetical protein